MSIFKVGTKVRVKNRDEVDANLGICIVFDEDLQGFIGRIVFIHPDGDVKVKFKTSSSSSSKEKYFHTSWIELVEEKSKESDTFVVGDRVTIKGHSEVEFTSKNEICLLEQDEGKEGVIVGFYSDGDPQVRIDNSNTRYFNPAWVTKCSPEEGEDVIAESTSENTNPEDKIKDITKEESEVEMVEEVKSDLPVWEDPLLFCFSVSNSRGNHEAPVIELAENSEHLETFKQELVSRNDEVIFYKIVPVEKMKTVVVTEKFNDGVVDKINEIICESKVTNDEINIGDKVRVKQYPEERPDLWHLEMDSTIGEIGVLTEMDLVYNHYKVVFHGTDGETTTWHYHLENLEKIND